MTNKTITLPRNLVEEVVQTCAFTLTEIAYQELRAALAEPVPPACCKCGKPTACGKMICEACCYEPLPVPPAGGEPEVVGWRSPDGRCITDTGTRLLNCDPLIRLSDHRAHVTQLKAEVTEQALCAASEARRALRAESELTKARECLKDLGIEWGDVSDMYQSAPADKGHGQGDPVAWAMKPGLDRISVNPKASHAVFGHSGEPGWDVPLYAAQPAPTTGYTAVDMSTAAAQGFRDGQAAAAPVVERQEPVCIYWDAKTQNCMDVQPPAPVAVVMPERDDHPDEPSFDSARANGWNECLDEFARLNPIKQ